MNRTGGAESSTNRALSILDLYTVERPAWSVDELQKQMGFARATIYRYVRELTVSGFLVGIAGGKYVLGPRFIEFDRQIRKSDPVIRFAVPEMEKIADIVNGNQLLCTFYGHCVMTVYQAHKDAEILKYTSMERGRPFSLFRGAPSKVILANLSNYQLKNVYLRHQNVIRDEDLGESWREFLANIQAIRKQGYWIGSELDSELVGAAAPIFCDPGTVVGAICLVRLRSKASEKDIKMLAELAVGTAEVISTKLHDWSSRPDTDVCVPKTLSELMT
jgi:DNA-binding IclR family transcriptional regulator